MALKSIKVRKMSLQLLNQLIRSDQTHCQLLGFARTPTPANNLPDDRISIAARALAHTIGFLTTMFKIEVPIKMRVVEAAIADNVLMASSQLV